MGRISNWESHYGVPDSYFDDYYKVFGKPEDREYYLAFGDDTDELDDINVDAIADEYAKMGPPDEDYMQEVRRRWEPSK